MDDEEKKPVTQIPLMNDLVFDESMPLRPPVKPGSRPKPRKSYSPYYDPDTIDLFDFNIEGAITEELRHNAEEVIEGLVSEYTSEIGRRLREELGHQLASILDDLNHRDSAEDPPDPA